MQNNNGQTDTLQTTKVEPHIGIEEHQRAEIVDGLQRFLANTYTLHLKTLNYHWHVKGMHFQTLHNFFEELYTDLNESMDEIAERVLQLGFKAPGNLRAMQELSNIKAGNEHASADQMLSDLLNDYQWMIRSMRQWRAMADEAGDAATVAMFDDRLTVFEKQAWMMRAMQS
ncbi:DNA starvation/stationary phase protection protein [bacterium]|nr:DNA starvation/stationary phase protection protein [bacterium]